MIESVSLDGRAARNRTSGKIATQAGGTYRAWRVEPFTARITSQNPQPSLTPRLPKEAIEGRQSWQHARRCRRVRILFVFDRRSPALLGTRQFYRIINGPTRRFVNHLEGNCRFVNIKPWFRLDGAWRMADAARWTRWEFDSKLTTHRCLRCTKHRHAELKKALP